MADDIAENFKSLTDFVLDAADDIKRVKDPKILTKSKFLNGLQCPKLLWTRCTNPESIPTPSENLQRIFDTGHQVGELATRRFPGGKRISEVDFLQNLEDTKLLLSAMEPRPIYEAGVLSGRIYSRADILRPSPDRKGFWDVIEVKCSTSCKDVHIQDIAFQRYCYEKAGIKINRCFLMHINNEYVRQGDMDVEGLFNLVDLTEETATLMVGLPQLIDGFLKIIDMPDCPNISIGPFCNKPYECQIKSLCWAFLRPGNVMELRGRKDKAFELLQMGITRLEDIPDPETLTDARHIQYLCALSGKPHIEPNRIKMFISGLKYPLYFVDFETVFEAIPRFDGAWPYQQIPFQFSLHIQKSPGAPLEHVSFLHRKADDPRQPFLQTLRHAIGSEGNVIVYNRTFEESHVLKKMQECYPEHQEWIDNVRSRFADLLDIFKALAYYHPEQEGSASIKKVLPVLTTTSYKGMAIADGGRATTEYARVTYGEGVDPADRDKVYLDLEAYCGLDTMAMVEILKKLKEMV